MYVGVSGVLGVVWKPKFGRIGLLVVYWVVSWLDAVGLAMTLPIATLTPPRKFGLFGKALNDRRMPVPPVVVTLNVMAVFPLELGLLPAKSQTRTSWPPTPMPVTNWSRKL